MGPSFRWTDFFDLPVAAAVDAAVVAAAAVVAGKHNVELMFFQICFSNNNNFGFRVYY
jgi:hypothetical protein